MNNPNGGPRAPFRMETERLTITEYTPDMAATVSRLSLDGDNRRFLPDEVFETEEVAARTLAWLIPQYGGVDGPLVYPLFLRATGEQIGHVEAVPLGAEWEIGYHIGGGYVGQGYATEAVRAFVPVIARRLGIDAMLGVCLADNAASRRVLEKAGFRLTYEGLGEYQCKQMPLCRFLWEAE